jgi:hypothetical protein
MKILFALLVILFVTFAGYHFSFRKVKVGFLSKGLWLTGNEYLLVGLALGPWGLDLLDEDTIKGLTPLSALVLGWAGMVLGFQFEISKLRRMRLPYLWAALVSGLVCMAVTAVCCFAFLPIFPGLEALGNPGAILALAAAAACTAPTGLALVAEKTLAAKREAITLLRHIAALDGALPLLIYALAFTAMPFTTGSQAGHGIGAMLAGGAALGLIIVLFAMFLAVRPPQSELLLLVMGMIVLTSGAASLTGFSPLAANFLLGFLLVNTSSVKERIYQMLFSVEKPAYLLLLIFLGALWSLVPLWLFAGAFVFLLSRLTGKVTGLYAATRLLPLPKKTGPWLGLGLLGQGGLGLAIMLEFALKHPHSTGPLALGVVLGATVLTDLFGPVILRGIFYREPRP